MNAIINGKIIFEDRILVDRILIFGENIVDIISKNEMNQYNIKNLYDAKGCYVSSGFIDIHTHGAMGHDVMDGDVNGIQVMSESHALHGVTGFLATTMTMDYAHIEKALTSIEKAINKGNGARILGCHLEGPFISEKNAGAQNPKFIRKPNFDILEKFKKLIKLITIAPEVEGSERFIHKCLENDIVVSIGHSLGCYEDAMKAIKNGATSITHTFNAMTPLHHREPGIVGAALEMDKVFCELIADNIHVHPAIQKVLLKAKGIDKVILITDSMSACSVGEGTYKLGGQNVIVKNESARLENGTLAGSILTMDVALKNFKQNTGISVVQAVKTATENPAKLLKIYDISGSLESGKVSDIAIFDDDFTIHYTFVGGKLSFAKIQ